jgi:hypothetical protein
MARTGGRWQGHGQERGRGREDQPVRRPRPHIVDLGPIGEDEWAVGDEESPTLRRVMGPMPLGAEVDRLLRRPGWSERLGAGRISARWVEVVGPELAARCEPVRLAGRVLVIRAESAAWATQLRYLTGQLRERLDVVLGPGSVRDVRIVIGRTDAPSDPDVRHHGRQDPPGSEPEAAP